MKRVTLLSAIVLFMLSPLFSEVTKTGQKGLVRAFSAKTLEQGKLVVEFGGSYSADAAYVVEQARLNSAGQVIASSGGGEPLIASGDMGLSFGIANFLDLSFALPLYYDQLAGGYLSAKGGPGDILIGMKLQYPPYEHTRIFDMAYLAMGTLPTGAKNKGLFPRHSYYIPKNDTSELDYSFYTAEMPSIDLKMLWSLL